MAKPRVTKEGPGKWIAHTASCRIECGTWQEAMARAERLRKMSEYEDKRLRYEPR